jgi:rhodanese-related sulfurtransferase
MRHNRKRMDIEMPNNNGNEPLRISVGEAKARNDSGNTVIVDVDDPGSFAEREEKITGARRIDPRDVADDYAKLPEDRAILAYCT